MHGHKMTSYFFLTDQSLYQADILFGVIQGTIHSKWDRQEWDNHHYPGIILWKSQ